jgi:hypothetical protein
MNAVAFMPTESAKDFRASLSAPLGSAAELRAFIGETMEHAAVQADLAATYVALGDDAGLEYALRRFAAYSKAAFATFADLKAMNARGGS